MIGDNVKRIRESQNLGLNETAKIAGISGSYLSNIEKNIKTNPSMETLKKIADALGVLVEDFFKDEENCNETTQELTPKDEKDISKDVKSIMSKITSREDGPTYYEGNELNEDDLELFRDALELALKRIKIKNKEKYTPKKYKK